MCLSFLIRLIMVIDNRCIEKSKLTTMHDDENDCDYDSFFRVSLQAHIENNSNI